MPQGFWVKASWAGAASGETQPDASWHAEKRLKRMNLGVFAMCFI
jgi:hypothetical protein